MMKQTLECREAVGAVVRHRRWEYAMLGMVCALVISVYALSVKSGLQESAGMAPADSNYNLLMQGFRAGQFNLKKEAPGGLVRLANPYDPAANVAARLQDRLLDLSFYRGKLYLYFGVTPALVLFWPWYELTGHYLRQTEAVWVFCLVGLLAGAGLLVAMWRRYFAEVSVGVLAAGIVAMGLGSGVPLLLARADVCEVPISCGYALTILTLLLIWGALHVDESAHAADSPRGFNSLNRWHMRELLKNRRIWWLGAASVAHGLAVGARPSLLFGAAILLVPVFRCAGSWMTGGEESRHPPPVIRHLACYLPRFGPLLLAATGPITVIGLGLLLYNYLRFDDLFEFGWRQQLGTFRQDVGKAFSLEYLGFNFRTYFLKMAGWSWQFPFVHGIWPEPLPSGYATAEHAFGVLTNLPVVWLALAAPLAWCGRWRSARLGLRWFGDGVVLLFGVYALTLCLFWAAIARYQVEFLSPVLLLAVLGIFGLEEALSSRVVLRWGARCGWGLLLGFSVAFLLLGRYEFYAETRCDIGLDALQGGRVEEAIAHFQKALALQPANARARNSLGAALFQKGQVPEAITQYEEAVRLKPDYAEAQHNLGTALLRQGRAAEALKHLEEGMRLKPVVAEAHNNLAAALAQLGRTSEAIERYEQALRIQPQHADAHYNFGNLLVRVGRAAEALPHFEQVLKVNPEHSGAHRNLAAALFQLGQVTEAVDHLMQALRLNPEDADTHFNLGMALAQQGKPAEALQHYQQALRLNPTDAGVCNQLAWLLATSADPAVRNGARAIELAREADQLAGGKDPAILDTLAAAYAEAGRFDDAVRTAQTAMALATANGQAERAQRIAARIEFYKTGRPYREGLPSQR